jgi:hypothetical protein
VPRRHPAAAELEAFVREQPALAREAAAIAGERMVGANHPVARHDDGDRIRANGKADRAHRRGAADGRRENGIARRRTGRDAAQGGPDRVLERRPAGRDRDIVDRREVAFEIGV